MKYQSKKYQRPLKPWSKERIDSEKKLKQDYGLRRKHEIQRAESILRNLRSQARELQSKHNKERERMLLDKLGKLGVIGENSTLDDVLALTVTDILNRRLQTVVWKRGFASTPFQARQYITHGHIAIDKRKVRWPSTLVNTSAESRISYYKKNLTEIKQKGGNVGESRTETTKAA